MGGRRRACRPPRAHRSATAAAGSRCRSARCASSTSIAARSRSSSPRSLDPRLPDPQLDEITSPYAGFPPDPLDAANPRPIPVAMARAKNLRLRLTAGALLPLIVAVAAQATYTLVSQREAMDKGLENKARALAGLMVNVARSEEHT